MSKTVFDLNCENFDHYFASQLPNLTPEAKDGLPRDIVFKLFRKGGDAKSKSTSKLSFLAKLYVLCRSLGKRWYLVIEDEERGLKLSQFNDIPRMLKERRVDMGNAEDFMLTGGYILADRELSDLFSYLNRLSSSKPYNYLVRAKNAPPNEITEENRATDYVTRFLMNYEGCKKDLVSQTGLNIPEFFVLMALYPGEETVGATLYNKVFKRSYQSSPAKIKVAFGTLQQRGYIRKWGISKGAKMQITPLGRECFRGILDKYLLNW